MNTPTNTADQNDTSLTTALNSEQHRPAPTTSGLVTRNVTQLLPYDRNSRTHSEAQIAQIAASIKEFGFTNPVLIDEDDTIIAGEGRVLAARKLKMPTVQCIVMAGLTDTQKAAYVIADNKLALNAGWNEETLYAELNRLAGLPCDLNLTGFSEVEIAALSADLDTAIEELAGAEDATDPERAAPEVGPSVGGQPHPRQAEPEDDWRGMPEFTQPEAGPFRTVKVHFKEQAAVDAFSKLIGQNLTDKTKWVWYPKDGKVAAVVVYG